jgi:glycosyltransferase involved in cell wall biosynthesis
LPQQDWIQQQELSAYVEYLGNPDKSRLIEIYNAANVLLAPSFHEGFGMTLLESLACGTPVITSNVSAMPEVVGDAGILIAPDDIEATVAAVERLYQDAAYCQALIHKGIERTNAFTWEKASEQIAQVYETLQPHCLL